MSYGLRQVWPVAGSREVDEVATEVSATQMEISARPQEVNSLERGTVTSPATGSRVCPADSRDTTLALSVCC